MAWVVERHGAKGTRYRGGYRDPDGRLRSAGTFSTRRDALRAANREEQKVLAGAWHDTTLGEVTFTDYVKGEWLPNKHVEASTRAAYISYLNKHFYPYFGNRRLNRISPSLVQDWVAHAKDQGLSPRSIRKYHVMLSSIFARAVKDRVLVHNPCDHTELPKVINRKARTLTPDEYIRLLAAIPDQHRLMVETLIEVGLRWGELVALKPRHIDFLRRSLTVEETIVEVSKKHSPTDQRYLVKPYPKDNHCPAHPDQRHQPRWTALRDQGRYADLTEHVPHPDLAPDRHREWYRLSRPGPRPASRPRLLAPRRRRRPRLRDGTHGPLADPDHPEVPPHPPRHRPTQSRRPHPHPERRGALTPTGLKPL
jgi:integrase